MQKFLIFTALLITYPLHAIEPDDLLKPDDAFAASVRVISPERIEASWKIADGYYLYRDKFKFETDTAGVTLGVAQLPAGKIKNDPGFGKVEVYRNSVAIEIPLTQTGPGTKTLALKTRSQGCADIGVCYPPQKKTLTLQLPEAQIAALSPKSDSETKQALAPPKKLSLAEELGITGIGNANAPLPPDEAFAFDITAVDQNTLRARWNITPGHYLYQDKIRFSLKDAPQGVSIGKFDLPQGKKENDAYFGEIFIYEKDFEIELPLEYAAGSVPDKVEIKTGYQGCSKLTGICYPPQHKLQTINLAQAAPARTQTGSASGALESKIQAAPDQGTADSPRLEQAQTTSVQKASEPDLPDDAVQLEQPPSSISTGNTWLDESLGSGNFSYILLATLLAGLALAFTACMYPMIPILSSIIVGQGKEVSALKGFSLSAIYVGSLALTFGIIGAITASVAGGIGIQAYFQHPGVLIAFALLFIVLAFSMFGFYDIQVPAAIQNRLSSLSNKQEGGSLIGVAIMGALSALIIGPCGGPILAAILSYAAVSASLFKGFAAMFALGLGMGLPLLVVGAGGGKLLPRAGTWMSTVKAGAGVILLAVSLVILERMPQLFPAGLTMLLWALLLIISGVYMGAFGSLPQDKGASGWYRFWKGLGVGLVFYGALVMLGGLLGGKTVTDPFHGVNFATQSIQGGPAAQSAHVTFKRIKTVDDLKSEIASAKQQGKAVMLDFYADWCTYCIKYEQYVFPEAPVKRYLDQMVLLQADVTATDEKDKELMSTLGISLPPAILFFDKNGKEVPSSRVLGYMDVDEFAAHLQKTLK